MASKRRGQALLDGWVHKTAKMSASEEPGKDGADVNGRFYQFIAIRDER